MKNETLKFINIGLTGCGLRPDRQQKQSKLRSERRRADDVRSIFRARPHAKPAPTDEWANLLTHGLGLLLSVMGAVALIQLSATRQDPSALLACSIYAATLVGLYAASTLSHAFFELHWRGFFQTLDQACIFFLISGSFTPFALFYLTESWWPALLIASWVLASCGAATVIWVGHLSRKTQVIYLLLGWMPLISMKVIIDSTSLPVVLWLLGGGAAYSLGTLFLHLDHRFRYFHSLWHVSVILGSACHFIAVWWVVSAMPLA